MRVSIEQRSVRLRTPLETSYGPPLGSRELFALVIEGADGIEGRGECAPLEPYDGVSCERARAALEHFEDRAEHAFTVRGGTIDVPRGPGLMGGLGP